MDLTRYLSDPLFIAFIASALGGYYFKAEIRDRINRFDSTVVFLTGYLGMMTVYLVTSKRSS